MNIALAPGRYVVAVSGGVDSVALLHVLQQLPGLSLTVAHFDHGIRPDSVEDMKLVQQLAKQYRNGFITARGELGPSASEAAARIARYGFLYQVQRAAGADAIITAHHKGDALETAVLNLVRGTGWRGLAGLQSTPNIKRPMLHLTKDEIRRYARDNQLVWHEDSTNADMTYRRNYIRHKVLARFSPGDLDSLHGHIQQARASGAELDELVQALLKSHTHEGKLARTWFIMLPHAAAAEVMAAWLRSHHIRDFDRKTIERLVRAGKVFPFGQRADVNHNNYLFVEKDYLALKSRER